MHPRQRSFGTTLGVACGLLLGTAGAEAGELVSGGLAPLVTTPGTLNALLLMRESFAELADAVLPVLTLVFALAVVRLWLERTQRTQRTGRARFWPESLALRWRAQSRTCVRPSTTAFSADFDRSEVLLAAKRRFVELQAAWDARDLERLRTWTTPEMLDELLGELPVEGTPGSTEVTALHAELLGFERVADFCLASIEFSGTVRESLGRETVSFREVWMLTHPIDAASEWRLARQQTLF